MCIRAMPTVVLAVFVLIAGLSSVAGDDNNHVVRSALFHKRCLVGVGPSTILILILMFTP